MFVVGVIMMLLIMTFMIRNKVTIMTFWYIYILNHHFCYIYGDDDDVMVVGDNDGGDGQGWIRYYWRRLPVFFLNKNYRHTVLILSIMSLPNFQIIINWKTNWWSFSDSSQPFVTKIWGGNDYDRPIRRYFRSLYMLMLI